MDESDDELLLPGRHLPSHPYHEYELQVDNYSTYLGLPFQAVEF